jgi:orotate phosphoribosyltransferase
VALNHIADLLLPILYAGECDYIGGLEVGAIPVLNAVAMRSAMPPNEQPIPLFWIRKHAKDHGTKRLLEGQDISDLTGHTAVMVDDITTTGMSVLKAIREARANGVTITRVLTIVDRLEGAAENLADENVELICLYDVNDFRAA